MGAASLEDVGAASRMVQGGSGGAGFALDGGAGSVSVSSAPTPFAPSPHTRGATQARPRQWWHSPCFASQAVHNGVCCPGAQYASGSLSMAKQPSQKQPVTRLQSTQGRLRVAASPHARTSIGIPDVRPCSAAAGCPCSAAAGTSLDDVGGGGGGVAPSGTDVDASAVPVVVAGGHGTTTSRR